ncbi:SDR family oxidoreductase [Streptomyces mirabilis]|uniref:SDR family oxidoreductase n=1 Tax=Streptomyces mirabilis TaxID=68239 RepID=UPI0033ABB4C6
MTDPLDMTGKVVVVTGGSRGVGDGIVETFLRAGATVETCGRTAPERLRDVDGRVATFSPVDVRDEEQIGAWAADVTGRHGQVDVLVNNAGGAPFLDFDSSSPRLLRKVLELNLTSAILVSHRFRRVMPSGGVVLNITSISARRPSPGTAVYGAAKAGLESLTGSLAVEWAPQVRVNAISCGLVATPGGDDHYGDADQMARIARTIPRGVLATPLEIGAACLMLASPLSRHITGAILNVDGGGEWPAFLQHAPRAPKESHA